MSHRLRPIVDCAVCPPIQGSELIAAKLGFEPTKDSGYSWRSFKSLPHETV